MTTNDLQAFYQERVNRFTTAHTQIKKKINLVANLRLLTAVAILVLLYFALANNTVLAWGVFPLLAVFILLVRKHAQLFKTGTHTENLVKINTDELQALHGDRSAFTTGAEFIDGQHPYTHDLDIFGEGSLFQALNRCNTRNGRTTFAHRLGSPLACADAIRQHQEAIRELAQKADFRQNLEAAGRAMNEDAKDYEQLLHWINQPAFVYPKPLYRYTLILLPAVTAALIVGSFFMSPLRGYAMLCVLAQFIITGLHLRRVNAFHEYISRKKYILEKYARLLYYLENETFSAPVLQQLAASAQQAHSSVKQLASLVSSFNARLNFVTTLVVNGTALYDLQYVYKLEKWKHDHAAHLKQWLEAVSNTEVLCSFGTFAFNNPGFQYATINNQLALSAERLAHPLIPLEICVTNDITLGDGPGVLIVTGANMAGKSTFLRTLGVNVILALNGAPVAAASFSCPILSLRTGMRTADSLKDNQSYFYAELNRLKAVMDELRSDKPLLILLDEILKGTNSTDKQAGSMALVKQLLPHPCLGIIATHDLALGDLEHEYPGRIANYCFEANIENDQLSFDYKLKPGLAQKMNATFLMKKMGIIPR